MILRLIRLYLFPSVCGNALPIQPSRSRLRDQSLWVEVFLTAGKEV